MEYKVSTPFGKFRIKKTGDMISVGGHNLCIQAVYRNTGSELLWLGTEKGGCELMDKPIRGSDTVSMGHLALSLLRKEHPDLKEIHLTDSSTFKCVLPDGSVRQISMMKSHFLFYGQTYYESRFGAVPRYDKSGVMDAYRKSWADPAKKPAQFDFSNPELTEILTPLYAKTDTWEDFFRAIQGKYGDKKCTIIYPWFMRVVGLLSSTEIPSEWTISMDSIPDIETTMIGGGRSTRRRLRRSLRPSVPHEYFWSGFDIYTMPYAAWAKTNHPRD